MWVRSPPDLSPLNFRERRGFGVRYTSRGAGLYALLTSGLPGETHPIRLSFAVRRSLSLEAEAAARRLRSLATFSARVRRRRISGRRLGADINFSLFSNHKFAMESAATLFNTN